MSKAFGVVIILRKKIDFVKLSTEIIEMIVFIMSLDYRVRIWRKCSKRLCVIFYLAIEPIDWCFLSIANWKFWLTGWTHVYLSFTIIRFAGDLRSYLYSMTGFFKRLLSFFERYPLCSICVSWERLKVKVLIILRATLPPLSLNHGLGAVYIIRTTKAFSNAFLLGYNFTKKRPSK